MIIIINLKVADNFKIKTVDSIHDYCHKKIIIIDCMDYYY